MKMSVIVQHIYLLYLWAVGLEALKKVKFFHTRYRALVPELIQVYKQSARR